MLDKFIGEAMMELQEEFMDAESFEELDMEAVRELEHDIGCLMKLQVLMNDSGKYTKTMHKHGDNWHKALADRNWKWIIYMILQDEVKDAMMDIEAHDTAMEHDEVELAGCMKTLAEQRIKNAEKLNAVYSSMEYTHGTHEEQMEWDEEYDMLMEQHMKNKEALA